MLTISTDTTEYILCFAYAQSLITRYPFNQNCCYVIMLNYFYARLFRYCLCISLSF